MMPKDTERKTPEAAHEFYRVSLTSGEAIAVLALLHAAPPLLADAEQTALDPAILQSAAERISDELPEFAADKARAFAAELTDALRSAFASSDRFDSGTEPFSTGNPLSISDKVAALELALESERPVEIKYYVASRDEWTRRIVDISDLYEEDGKWYLEGFCRLRRDSRVFRVDNIGGLRLRDNDVT